MPRFRLDDHPFDPELWAEYGFDPDPLVGYFVHCFHGDDILVFYQASEPNYDCERPIAGALEFLVRMDFFPERELRDALAALAAPEPMRVSPGVRRVMSVVRNFRSAGDN